MKVCEINEINEINEIEEVQDYLRIEAENAILQETLFYSEKSKRISEKTLIKKLVKLERFDLLSLNLVKIKRKTFK